LGSRRTFVTRAASQRLVAGLVRDQAAVAAGVVEGSASADAALDQHVRLDEAGLLDAGDGEVTERPADGVVGQVEVGEVAAGVAAVAGEQVHGGGP
jgi:hypothetical protein